MEESGCSFLIVEGDWSPAQTRTLKNKLQLYFGSKKKSGGGECRVEAEVGTSNATVFFASEAVRESVLSRGNHEVILDNQTVKLRLITASIPSSSVEVSDSTDSNTQKSEVYGGSADFVENKEELSATSLHLHQAKPSESDRLPSTAVLLDNVVDMSADLLTMLVENISGLDDNGYSLEILWKTNRAVIAFNSAADAEKFLTGSQPSQKLQRYGLTAQPLEATKSIKVENLPPNVVEGTEAHKVMLELYFEKDWALPDRIVMIPEEQAAIVTFSDARVVQNICLKQDYSMRSIPFKLYPYYDSLGAALYGKERAGLKMPDSFTERVHHVILKFLLKKRLSKSINEQMRPYFCSVEFDEPEVKLSPHPRFWNQSGLTANQIDMWKSSAREAFHQLMSKYVAFECSANAAAWKVAEEEVGLIVSEDVVLMLNASRESLTVAGQADDIKRIRAPVETIVLKAMNEIKRQTDSVSEEMTLSPAMFFILNHDGLQKTAQNISPKMKLSYNDGIHKLTMTGLPAEVFQTKSWVLERTMGMSKKQIDIPQGLLDFLKTVDPVEMALDIFMSQGISAVYSIENKGLLLLGSSDSGLADAEKRFRSVLTLQILDVKDQEVLKHQKWVSLNKQFLDTYNSTKKRTVAIEVHPESRQKVLVAGFKNPVKEVSCGLKEYIVNYSQVREAVRVKSCAVLKFLVKRKSQDWSSIAKDNDVTIHYDEERPKFTIAGPRLHVLKAKSCFQELIKALSTDNFIVDKPGAKKYFLSQGSLILSTLMSDLNCVVMLRPDNPEEEEEEGNNEDGNNLCYCKVRTANGVLVSVSNADICTLSVDAVVNAANEKLQHIGGLAFALLKAAGPQLQKISDDYITKNGILLQGEAVVTGACSLPCKYVIHTVGPRFYDYDKETAVARLKHAVQESLTQAEKVNCSTIALPAISSGVFGFPVDLCAKTIAHAVRDYCDSAGRPGSLSEIYLVDNNDNTVRDLATAVKSEFKDLGPSLNIPQKVKDKGKEASGPERFELITAEGLKIVLRKGNIQDQTTNVIVNTISGDLDLEKGAVSKALLLAAGPGLQRAVRTEATSLRYGDVVITNGFNLSCQKVFHAVCRYWTGGAGQREELTSIIRYCLEEAESYQMTSLSFPAIGTGSLSFPRDVVSRVLLTEIHSHSQRRTSHHLKVVIIVVHPTDNQTVECFIREFSGQTGRRNIHRGAQHFSEVPVRQPGIQSQQSSASSFSQVSSTSLGVYRMQMGQLTLEVSSGDITKEACDVIINPSNKDFSLKFGVSKAILDGAGLMVEQECSQMVNSQGYKPSSMIITSAGMLPSRNIIHVVGNNDPAQIQDMVYCVLKFCEENKFSSVSFPALGTGQGRASPSAVADAMVGAVAQFVRIKHQRFVCSVKILIFQAQMMPEFHKSLKKTEGEENPGIFTKIKNYLKSKDPPSTADLVLEREELEPIEFQLCAENDKVLSQAKEKIKQVIVAEQMERTITDPYINQLTQADMDQLNALQRKLSVRIHLIKGLEDPKIHLEGLTRDVSCAESAVRDIILKMERREHTRSKALLLSGLVEWQYQDHDGTMVPFDIYTNLNLEEDLETKVSSVKITIKNQTYNANVQLRKAVTAAGGKEVELFRKDLKGNAALPSHWDDMKGDLIKLFPLPVESVEYRDVKELTMTSFVTNILSIERVQNTTLWQSYQLMKKELEMRNQHTNNERRLFHGTGVDSIQLINKQGFNRSYAGTHAALFGNGSYFAVDPNYSARGYAKPDKTGYKHMYLARVLVGDFVLGRRGMITPPAKSLGKASDLYDSVVDNILKPSMFVIFSDIQAYPEYLITFK